MKTFVKNFLLSVSPPEEAQLNVEEHLISEIETAKDKLQSAWNHFDYAELEYVELAVLELLLAETHYSLLNKRYRMMLGLSETPFSLAGHLHNHAFYSAFFSPSQH